MRKKAEAQTGSQPAAGSHSQGEGLQLPPWAPLHESLWSMSHLLGMVANPGAAEREVAFFCCVSHSSGLRVLCGLGFRPGRGTRCQVIRLSLNPPYRPRKPSSGLL